MNKTLIKRTLLCCTGFLLFMTMGVLILSCDPEDYRIPQKETKQNTIIDVSPKTGKYGDLLELTGTSFSALSHNNKVRFNGALGTVNEVITSDSTEVAFMIVRVPKDATTGPISLSHKDLMATTPFDFVVVSTIASFSPTVGGIGRTVIIEGTNFNSTASENEVCFNGTLAAVTEATVSTLTVTVPEGATDGPIKVTAYNQTGTSTSNFVVKDVELKVLKISIEQDIEEGEQGAVYHFSSDLEMGSFDSFGSPDFGNQNLGFRFSSIDIPVGATIQSANIVFIVDEVGSDPTEMTIYAEKNGNSMPFLTTPLAVSNKEKTIAHTVWRIPPWLSEGDQLPSQRTVNLASLIQEVVQEDGWQTGNAINFILIPSGPSENIGPNSANEGRVATSLDNNDYENKTTLTIEYY